MASRGGVLPWLGISRNGRESVGEPGGGGSSGGGGSNSSWVANDVLGTPSSLDQKYLDELKLTGVLFGGGDLER
ncbi:hypothetical protein PIB30_042819 [Stylosanthes scabra]|uniref:Uncharacterized protein n=1 Tax=Stylosanthes scabra TaxID=79078 RepID=A0ABU6UE47_9FABA|nr:hypothetical protein [Stylosanthes scabra]